MGAGCHYTLKDDSSIKAYWLDFGTDYNEFTFDIELLNLNHSLLELPLCSEYSGELYYGECFKIVLESKYNGDGIVIDLQECMSGCEPHYELMLSKLESMYNKIIKHLNKYFPLTVATSGYTSYEYKIGEIK